MSETIITRYKLEVDELVTEANKAANAVKGVGDDAATSSKKASQSLGEVTSALKDNQRASRELGKTIKEQEKLTNEWRQELLRVEREQKNVGRGSREYFKLQQAQKDLNRAIKENVTDIKGLKLEKSVVDGNVRDLKKQERQLKKNSKELDRASKKTSAFGEVVKNVGRFLLAAFAVDRIIAGIRGAINTISEYQSAVSELGGISGATDEQIKSLTRTARNFAKESQFTATQVVKAQTELAKLGRTVEEIEQTTEAVLLLATAAGTDVPNAAEVAAQTMNQFGIETERAGEVADILSKSFTSSSLTIQRFQGAFKAVGTTANVVGASLEETTAIISALSDAGIPAEKAGTDLRNIYIALAEEGISWAEAQERLLNSTDKLATATDLFGRRSGAAGLIIAQNSEKIAQLTGAYQNAEGAAQDLADAQLDNLKGDQLLLTSAYEEFLLRVEEGTGIVSRFGRGLTQALTDAVSFLGAFGDEVAEAEASGERVIRRLIRLQREGEDITDEQIEQAKEKLKLRVDELKFQRLSFDAQDDIVVKEELNNELVRERLKLLEAEKKALEITFAEQDKIVDTDIRILFLKGEISKADRNALLNLQGTLEQRRELLAQINKENAAKATGNQLSEDELALQREISAQRIALRVAEQERNNAIINDALNAEIASIEATLQAAKDAGDENIRNREQLNGRLLELNQELLRSDLRLAKVREEAKQAEIALLQGISDKTPAIQAQIIAAQTELVGLSRAVDDIFLKLATGATNFAINPNLAEDTDFSAGIGAQLEPLEEAVLGMNERLQESYQATSKRAIEIFKDTANAGITWQQALEQAKIESEKRILQAQQQNGMATIQVAYDIFSSLASLTRSGAENSREFAVFQIAAQTAISLAQAIAGATSAGAAAGPAAPVVTPLFIAELVGITLAGIAQAKAALRPVPSFQGPSFEGGGATSGNRRSGGVDGKGGFYSIVHPKEYVIDSLNPDKGLRDLFADPKMAGIISRWSFKDRLSSGNKSMPSSVRAELSDGRIVNELQRNRRLTKMQLEEMRKVKSSPKFKRAG